MTGKTGWTAKGVYLDEKAVYRVEEQPEGFYMFIFKENSDGSERDELQDTLEIAKRSAEDWGADPASWIEEEWNEALMGWR